MCMPGDKESLSDIQQEASNEASERADAQSAAQSQQSESGDEPDSGEQFDQARQDADWDAAVDHVDSGGKIEK